MKISFCEIINKKIVEETNEEINNASDAEIPNTVAKIRFKSYLKFLNTVLLNNDVLANSLLGFPLDLFLVKDSSFPWSNKMVFFLITPEHAIKVIAPIIANNNAAIIRLNNTLKKFV